MKPSSRAAVTSTMKYARGLFLVILAATPLAADGLWFHLKVEESRGSGAKVRVNLPLAVVGRVADHIPSRHSRRCSIDVDGDSFDYAEMRALVGQALAGKEGETFALRRDDATVVVMREKDRIKLFFHDDDRDSDHVEITVPIDVADAMARSEDAGASLKAGIATVASRGSGNVMTVRSDDSIINIWIDRSSSSQ